MSDDSKWRIMVMIVIIGNLVGTCSGIQLYYTKQDNDRLKEYIRILEDQGEES